MTWGWREALNGLPIASALLVLLVLAAACGGLGAGNTDTLQRGSRIYKANCASCHGALGEGDPGWRVQRPDGSYAPPPHNSSGHTWHHGDGLLFQIVKHGGASLNIPDFKSGMPAFKGTLKDDEVRAVILYLKTLWGPKEREFQAGASQRDPFP
jgi:mono/diheme cytochrome c family protein